jgi:hypothetical protein
MFKIIKIVKTANEAIAKILEYKHFNLFEIIHLIYSAAKNITEGINGIGSYQSGIQSPKTPPWVRRIEECINYIKRAPSAVAKTERDEKKNVKKKAIA